MKIFKLKKGGQTENVEEVTIILRRIIDDELLKKAINICAKNDFTVSETIEYLSNQFECIDFITYDDLDTFYC